MFLGHENAGKHNFLNMGRRINDDDDGEEEYWRVRGGDSHRDISLV